MTLKGRLLGVDFGRVRVGLAITDSERIIASPLATYQRQDESRDAVYFRDLIKREQVVGLIVGLPVHMSGDEGEKAKEARAFGDWLGRTVDLSVVYWDERFTSKIADSMMRHAGLKRDDRKAKRDRIAAQLILSGYLEAGCPTESPTPQPDAE